MSFSLLRWKRVELIVELIPPKRADEQVFVENIKHILQYTQKFSITCHPRHQLSGHDRGINLVKLIREQISKTVELVFHLTCRDVNKLDIDTKLHELNSLQVNNLLLVTGDRFEYSDNSFESSLELLKYINHKHHGKFKNLLVAGYPQRYDCHSHNQAWQIVCSKIEAGCTGIITQCIYELEDYSKFAGDIRKFDRSIEVIPSVTIVDRERFEELKFSRNSRIRLQDGTLEKLETKLKSTAQDISDLIYKLLLESSGYNRAARLHFCGLNNFEMSRRVLEILETRFKR